MSIYELMPEEGRTYNYKIEGDTIAVSQYDMGSMIFLRVEKPDVTTEELEAFKESMKAAAGNVDIIILPPWVAKMVISPAVQQTGAGKMRKCVRCGRSMVQTGTGFMCYHCGNETAPSTKGGEAIDVGGM